MHAKALTRRQQQSLQTESTILSVSLELFVTNGYAATSVRDIAKRANVSPGLMFHYFRSKDELLQAHVKRMSEGMRGVIQEMVSSVNPQATFRSIASRTLESLKDHDLRNLFLLANQVLSLKSMPAAARRSVSRSTTIDATSELISQGQKKGQIRKGDPRALAIAFWGVIQGIAEIIGWDPKATIPDVETVMAILEI